MKRLQEIEARLAAIAVEAEDEAITAEKIDELNAEADALTEERKGLLEAVEKRNKLLETVGAGAGEVTKTFENEETEVREMRETKEYRNAWLKQLQGKELTEAEQRAYAASDAHNAIPTLVADKFFEKMKKLAPMLSEITLMRVAGNLKFVTQGTRNAASKHTENSAVSAAGDTVVTVTLGGYEFMKVIGISKAASAQSVDAFEEWLVEMLSGDIARAIDDYIINDSSNGIAHIAYTTGDNQLVQTATTGYGYTDLAALVALLPAAYDAEAKFLMNKKTLWNKVKGIVDSNKRPIFDPTNNLLLGYPVLVDDYVSTSDCAIYLGKWTDVVGNLSQDVTVERDESSGFLSATINYRGYALFDSKPAKTDGIVRLVTTA